MALLVGRWQWSSGCKQKHRMLHVGSMLLTLETLQKIHSNRYMIKYLSLQTQQRLPV